MQARQADDFEINSKLNLNDVVTRAGLQFDEKFELFVGFVTA